MVKCQYCNQEFETIRKCSCHERLCKQRPDYEERLKRFKAGCGKSKGKQLVKRIEYDLVCDVCGKHYTKILTESEFKHIKHFNCSRSCANYRTHSNETKEKIRNSILKYCKDNNRECIKRYCKACNKELSANNKSGYCNECYRQTEEYKNKLSKSLKGKTGGYRKGSGWGKSGWYKGYYCDSSWELAFVVYNIEHNIKFERNKKQFSYIFKNEKHNYIPDWIVNDEYIEIKGYYTEQWQAKLDQFPKNLKLNILYENDMQKYLDYIREKYGNNFIELYDNSKPVKDINDAKAAWFHLKNEKTKLLIQVYVFKKNYDIFLNNGWKLGRYLPTVDKEYTVVKHHVVHKTEEEKERILRSLIE